MSSFISSHRRRVRLTAIASVGGAAVVFGLMSASSAAGLPVSPSAPQAALRKGFVDVSAVSPSDAWRIAYVSREVGKGNELLEHWDGTRWRSIPHPKSSITASSLKAVDARTSDDVWAVGEATSHQGTQSTLAEHWDGHVWTVVSTPGDGGQSDLLNGVSADEEADAWAVGFVDGGIGGDDQGLAEHWDGQSWKVTTLPTTVGPLTSVDALSPIDAWAVGSAGVEGHRVEVVLHWDGSVWSIVDSQDQTRELEHDYSSAVALTDDDVWVLGSRDGTSARPRGHWPYARHFDGSTWSDVPTARAVHDRLAEFSAAAPDGAGGLWAVGGHYTEYYDEQSPLIEHWDGTRWSVEPVPSLPLGDGLSGVSAGSPTTAWAVGGAKAGKTHELVWDGTAWYG